MEDIYDASGHLIGRIGESGGRKELISSSGQLLGVYYPDANETIDASGHLVGRGDQLMRLLPR